MLMLMKARRMRTRHWNTFQRSIAATLTRKISEAELRMMAHIDWMFRSEWGRDSTFWMDVMPDQDFKTVLRLLEDWCRRKCSPHEGEEGEVSNT